MANYDPNVIRAYADRLYTTALLIMVVYTVVGCLAGAVVAAAIFGAYFNFFHFGLGVTSGQVVPAAGLLLGLFGFAIGHTKAFSLRLQAQQALCQLQIEENTRGSTAT